MDEIEKEGCEGGVGERGMDDREEWRKRGMRWGGLEQER